MSMATKAEGNRRGGLETDVAEKRAEEGKGKPYGGPHNKRYGQEPVGQSLLAAACSPEDIGNREKNSAGRMSGKLNHPRATAPAQNTNTPRETPLEHTLFACDELAGFLTACALVKPGKSIFEVEPDSVKRKLKDKAFARGVNRDDVRKGAEELAVPIEEHIAFCIAAMREVADTLGLRGNQAASAWVGQASACLLFMCVKKNRQAEACPTKIGAHGPS